MFFCSSSKNTTVKELLKLVHIQGRLFLSTDGDKCAMVIFWGNEKSNLGMNEKVIKV